MKLSDNTISHLIQLLQVAILTGTDITDNFRMIELEVNDDKLEINEEYLAIFKDNLDKIASQANNIKEGKEEILHG